MRIALVVPSNRCQSILNFLSAWKDFKFDDIIVIEDSPKRTFDVNLKHHYSWQEINDRLGQDSWIISRRDSSIRCFGFYIAFKHCRADFVVSLDDDCLPVENNFIQKHLDAIENCPKWSEPIIGFKTRGCPYVNTGKLDNIVLNMGLWTNNPDLDSVQSLSNIRNKVNFELPKGNRILSRDQYIPICNMNICFKTTIIPLMYSPLMGDGYIYKRFDDVWQNIICQRVLRHLGWNISVGEPFVNHNKQSDIFTNLRKECEGIIENEKFWEVIENIQLRGTMPSVCMLEIADGLQKTMDDYYSKLGKAIKIWVRLIS